MATANDEPGTADGPPASPLDPDPARRFPALAALRGRCPVHELAPGRFVAVTHESVATGLRSIDSFGGGAGQRGLPEEDTMISAILEPRHAAVRRIINSVVAFHKSQQIESYLRDFIDARLDELVTAAAATDGPVEVMGLFVEPLPPAAMARLMGFPEVDSKDYFRWGDELGRRFGEAAANGQTISMRDGSPELAAYVEGRIDEREATPETEWPNDALTRFLTAEVEGERLTRRAVVTQIMFSIGAGSDTTRNVLGSLLYRLALDPTLFASIRADRTLVEPTIEEALRLDSPAQFLVRQCLAPEFDLGGTTLYAGETVLLSIGSANRDDEVFAQADSFDPSRTNLRDHLGFGIGPHICPGSALARLELRLALDAWCTRIKRFELGPGYEWPSPPTGMLHGPESLTLQLTPV